jgi:hypothetical protein
MCVIPVTCADSCELFLVRMADHDLALEDFVSYPVPVMTNNNQEIICQDSRYPGQIYKSRNL